MTWVQEIWARSGRQLRRLGGFLLAALVIGFGVEWLATSNARMILVQPAAINDIALSPDGEMLAIAYANGVVELRETGHARRLIRRFESARAPIMDLHLDDATAVGLRLTMAHADGRLAIETARDGQKLSDELTFTQSLLTPQFKVAEDGAIWAHGINEQGAWIGRLEPDGNFAQPVGMGETGSSKMTLLSATSERAHMISDTVHTIWTLPIEQTNEPLETAPKSPPELESDISRMTGTPGIIERVALGDGYVTTQDGHVMASVNGAWRTATEFFVERAPSTGPALPTRDQIGGITIYGGGAQGEGTTASGEPFNSSALTAAHLTLPFDTQIEVTNLNNNQSVVLRVNDRGPFEDDQIVGVTAVGAMQLGLVTSSAESGPPRVRLRVLETSGEETAESSVGLEQLETVSRELSVQRDGALTAAVFSNNGEMVATAAEDASAILWSAETLSEIGPLRGHTEGVLDIHFSPDDERVVTASRDGTARIWNAQTLQEIATLSGHEGSVRSAIFSNNGRLIATFDDADRIRVFDARTYDLIDEIADPSNTFVSPVMSLDFSPDDQHLLVGYIGGSISAWSMRSGLRMYEFSQFGAAINSVEYSRDGSQILLADGDGRIFIRTLGDEDATSNAALSLVAQVPGQFGARSALFSPDETQILALESDGSVRIWDASAREQSAGDEIATLTTSESFTVSTDYSPDGSRILIADQSGKASIFTETVPNVWQPARVGDNCRSEDGVAHLQRSGTEAQSLWMWSKDTWLCELSFDENQLSWVYALPADTTTVEMLPRGDDGPVSALLLGRADGTVVHREVQSEQVHAVYRGHGGPITQIETVDMGGTLRAAIAAADGSVQIVDLPNGAPSLFAKTNTDVNGFIAGLNALRGGLIDSFVPIETSSSGSSSWGALSDPLARYQWNIQSPSVVRGGAGFIDYWEATGNLGSSDVVVALIDTGIDPTLPEFANMNILPGADMVSDLDVANDGDGRDLDPTDPGDTCPSAAVSEDTQHGSHNLAAMAAPHDSIGIAGYAPGVSYVPIRAMGRCGGRLGDINDSVLWAVGQIPLVDGAGNEIRNENPADIIALPLGLFRECPASMQEAISTASALGAVVVAAAGNQQVDVQYYAPAGCDDVITVAGSDARGMLFGASNFGSSVDLMAPSGDLDRDDNADGRPDGILSTRRTADCVDPITNEETTDCEHAFQVGTTMSVMHVVAALALIQSEEPGRSPTEAADILLEQATRQIEDQDIIARSVDYPGCERIEGDPDTCLRPVGGRILDMSRLVGGSTVADVTDRTPSRPIVSAAPETTSE